MIGKYSPTVSRAYWKKQGWWDAVSDGLWDEQGYDQYGYNREGLDREGYSEWDYDEEDLYHAVEDEWGFDGRYPMK